MAISITKKVFIQRIRQHMANGWPNDEFSITDNEVLLYLDSATASTVVATMLGMAKITGEMATPEAYIVTTQLSVLVKNEITNEWYTTLPQTPLSLSIGYSITNAYFGDPAYGESQPIWLIKNKRKATRYYLPNPVGVSAGVRGNNIYVKSSDGTSLLGLDLYVDMVQTRTNDKSETVNMPDDVFDAVFDKVIMKCKDRLGMPRDIIKDDVGEGNTNVKQ